MPDFVIAPAGAPVSCTATVANQQILATAKVGSHAVMFVNMGGTAAFAGLVSVGASVGDAANISPFAGIGATLFVGLSPQATFGYVSGASSVFAQAVNFLK